MIELLQMLSQYNLDKEREDVWVWQDDEANIYTVKSTYKKL